MFPIVVPSAARTLASLFPSAWTLATGCGEFPKRAHTHGDPEGDVVARVARVARFAAGAGYCTGTAQPHRFFPTTAWLPAFSPARDERKRY